MKSIAQFWTHNEALSFQERLAEQGFDAEVRYVSAGHVGILGGGTGCYHVYVAPGSEDAAERALEEQADSATLAVEGLGEFRPTTHLRTTVFSVQGVCPNLSLRDSLVVALLQYTIAAARRDESGQPAAQRVTAGAILSVARSVALREFGDDARRWMRGLGLSSSSRLGAALYRFIEEGIFKKEPGDSPQDFDVVSDYDSFMREDRAQPGATDNPGYAQ